MLPDYCQHQDEAHKEGILACQHEQLDLDLEWVEREEGQDHGLGLQLTHDCA